jgi:mRNA interferase MazF
MEYKRGDIVLVNFNPQKRAEEVSKIRPAIIVSDTELNGILDLLSVVALTTNLIDDALPLRVRIPKKENLQEDSDAMIEQLRNVSKSRIGERLTSLDEKELAKIEYGIKAMLGLL